MLHVGNVTCSLIAALAIVSVSLAQVTEDATRKWTSDDGDYSVVAKFESISNFQVMLTKVDGKRISIAVEKLCIEDHSWISDLTGWGHTWRTKTGKILHVGKIASVEEKRIIVDSITGKKVKVSRAKLGPDSRIWVASFLKKREEARASALLPGASTTSAVPRSVLKSDQEVRERIANCLKISDRIRIDGRANDWEGLPRMRSDRAIADGSRDITHVSIAPLEKELLVAIRTRENPNQTPWAFYIRIDFVGQRANYDVQIGLSAKSRKQLLKAFDEENNSEEFFNGNVKGIKVEIHDIVEVKIPYAAIDSALPDKLKNRIADHEERPFLRVETMTFDHESESIVDYGPSVASYRFLEEPYPLDSKPRGKNRKWLPILVPFDGKWLVGHGAIGYSTHANIHAYDFLVVDQTLSPSQPRKSSNNEDYFSFGRSLKAPLDGRIVYFEGDHPDVPPGIKDPKNRANKAILGIPGKSNVHLFMLHFKQESIQLEKGQRISVGENLALCGNSGMTGAPHLHLELVKGRQSGPKVGEANGDKPGTIPLAFEKAIVSLNPAGDDPWARYVANWEIRPAVFVEAVKE